MWGRGSRSVFSSFISFRKLKANSIFHHEEILREKPKLHLQWSPCYFSPLATDSIKAKWLLNLSVSMASFFLYWTWKKKKIVAPTPNHKTPASHKRCCEPWALLQFQIWCASHSVCHLKFMATPADSSMRLNSYINRIAQIVPSMYRTSKAGLSAQVGFQIHPQWTHLFNQNQLALRGLHIFGNRINLWMDCKGLH